MGRYNITRDKFLSTDEVRRLLKVCEEQAELDFLKGRQIWVTRHMLVSLALRSGLRVKEIAALKIGDIHFSTKGKPISGSKVVRVTSLETSISITV